MPPLCHHATPQSANLESSDGVGPKYPNRIAQMSCPCRPNVSRPNISCGNVFLPKHPHIVVLNLTIYSRCTPDVGSIPRKTIIRSQTSHERNMQQTTSNVQQKHLGPVQLTSKISKCICTLLSCHLAKRSKEST